jgi:hypothetical protein
MFHESPPRRGRFAVPLGLTHIMMRGGVREFCCPRHPVERHHAVVERIAAGA